MLYHNWRQNYDWYLKNLFNSCNNRSIYQITEYVTKLKSFLINNIMFLGKVKKKYCIKTEALKFGLENFKNADFICHTYPILVR